MRVAAIKVWYQVSPECDTEPRLNVMQLTDQTTVGEIMAWADSQKGLGNGDVTICDVSQPTNQQEQPE